MNVVISPAVHAYASDEDLQRLNAIQSLRDVDAANPGYHDLRLGKDRYVAGYDKATDTLTFVAVYRHHNTRKEKQAGTAVPGYH
ncbi:hypothetical protein SAMN05443575_4082 [Jatrophihabitans endophyticus]|uniref:Uncharacterized protein n=1 Tax=Jatrophihabitans endophyticus TaxID=1206085 RepID=A0A1M5TYI9_9ACTN|nr:hypothetical protein [Jatrophihabitans endophyticus]SHH55895.1 hypothetical protein SAMN05443575_4082 [Jatrophihabitans endophyticus]